MTERVVEGDSHVASDVSTNPMSLELNVSEGAINTSISVDPQLIEFLSRITKQDIIDVVSKSNETGFFESHQILLAGFATVFAALIAFFAPPYKDKKSHERQEEKALQVWSKKQEVIITDIISDAYDARSSVEKIKEHLALYAQTERPELGNPPPMPSKDSILISLERVCYKFTDEDLRRLSPEQTHLLTTIKFNSCHIKSQLQTFYDLWERHIRMHRYCQENNTQPFGDVRFVNNFDDLNFISGDVCVTMQLMLNSINNSTHVFSPKVKREIEKAKTQIEELKKKLSEAVEQESGA